MVSEPYVRIVNSGISVTVPSRESNELVWAWNVSAVSSDVELCARRVKLGSTDTGSEVQSDDFVSKEVFTRFDVQR